jgi:hypothetical protein
MSLDIQQVSERALLQYKLVERLNKSVARSDTVLTTLLVTLDANFSSILTALVIIYVTFAFLFLIKGMLSVFLDRFFTFGYPN